MRGVLNCLMGTISEDMHAFVGFEEVKSMAGCNGKQKAAICRLAPITPGTHWHISHPRVCWSCIHVPLLAHAGMHTLQLVAGMGHSS